MYLSNSTEYMGEKEFFSKFGLEIKNNVNVIVSKRTFTQRVPQNTYTRPKEGDLVYIPFLNSTGELYEIKFVNQNKDYFMMGRKVPYFYELEMEQFKYSQEVINTGVADIDVVVADSAYTIHLNTGSGTGIYNNQELVYQSPDLTYANATVVATVQSWLPQSSILSVTNIAGEFVDGNIIVGASSNARFTLSNFDPLNNPANKEVYDNEYIANSTLLITDSSEINPFGSI